MAACVSDWQWAFPDSTCSLHTISPFSWQLHIWRFDWRDNACDFTWWYALWKVIIIQLLNCKMVCFSLFDFGDRVLLCRSILYGLGFFDPSISSASASHCSFRLATVSPRECNCSVNSSVCTSFNLSELLMSHISFLCTASLAPCLLL